MSRGKLTISVADLLERWNHQLTLDFSQEVKRNICTNIETLLFRTNNYEGFGYQYNWKAASEDYQQGHEYDRQYYVNTKLRSDYRMYEEIRAKDPHQSRL